MQRRAMAIVVALLVSACGETLENADPADPLPATTAVVITASSTTTSTSGPPGFAAAGAATLHQEIIAETGWGIPAVARPDFAADACSRDLWEPEAAYEFAEMLLLDEYLGWGADLSEANLDAAIRFAWTLAASTCPDLFPVAALAAGPPAVRALPACSAPWPYRLPWTDEAGEPDESATAGGFATATWLAPERNLTTAAGRSEGFIQAQTTGVPIGTVDGHDAVAVENGSSVTIAWEVGPRHCDARQVTIAPVPETDDLAGYVDGLMVVPRDAYLNDAERRMLAAVDLLDGYDHLGGEPSHGGPDAVYGVESPSGAELWLYAVPVAQAGADLYPDLQSTERETVAGVDVAYGIAAEGDVAVAVMEVDGYLLISSTDATADAARAFVPVWIEAWRIAAG